jgi:hypothetical protein
MYRFFTVFAVVFMLASQAGAQQYQRRATMIGGGSGDRGKCTIEVVVDGAADVEIRGDQGTIKNISGRPAEWRRFECSASLPANPADFRFAGIDGRGRQQLVRDPRNGGVAIVRVEDSDGGTASYTFELMWGGGNNPGPDRGGNNSVIGNAIGGAITGMINGENRAQDRDRYPERATVRFTTEQAVNACQDAIRGRAQERFGRRGVEFLNTRIDDNPGRNDWVVGMIDVHHDQYGQERFRFSCSVNFDNGQVRSAQIEPTAERDRDRGDRDRLDRDRAPNPAPAPRFTTEQAVSVCQDSVRQQAQDRFRGRRVEFLNTRIDDNPGRNDFVIGMVDVIRGRNMSEGRYKFSCSVNFDTGEVRSAQIDPRREQRNWR